MKSFPRYALAALAAFGCGGATTDDGAKRGTPSTPTGGVPTTTACSKYDLINEPCRVLAATPDLASGILALELAFQRLAANRYAMREACRALAGKLGVSTEDALLEPDVAAPVCEIAARAIRAESETFAITAPVPACVDAKYDLCRKDETVATAACNAPPEGAAQDTNRPDLVERLSLPVSQFVAESRAASQNSARFVELSSKLTRVGTAPPASCAAPLMGALANAAKLVIEDVVKAQAALRQ